VFTGSTPILKPSEQYFFKLSDPRCFQFLKEWLNTPGRLQPEMVNKVSEWLGENGEKLADWDISRDAPYFGIPIPDAPGKFFYVWLDAPVGYLASLKNYFEKQGIDYEAFLNDPGAEQVHFIGKDIVSFHLLFWPAMLNFSGHPIIDKLKVNVHGHLTVNNEKMSKSRGTGISPLRYLELGMNPEWLRYYLAFKLNAKVEDLDFTARFRRPREQRPDRQIRQHRQPLRRLHRQEVRRQAGRQPVGQCQGGSPRPERRTR
jgi:methionyl-tRNA synthetase